MGTTCTIIPDRFRGIKPSPLVCANERREGGREGVGFSSLLRRNENIASKYIMLFTYIFVRSMIKIFLHFFISFIIILYEFYYRIIYILGRIVINLFIKFRNYFFFL